MKIADITVAIAALDRPASLERCLDALWSGDVQPAEMVVVDQSQNNLTTRIVENRRARGMPIVYIRQPKRGLSASRNAGLTRASCPIVAVTDDDCVPDRMWVSTLASAFASTAAPDAVTGRVLPLGAEMPGLYAIASRTSPTAAEFKSRVVPWIVGTGANFAAKRDWLLRVGGYDERLGTGSPGAAGEDMDMIYKLLRKRALIQYKPEVLIYHERQNRSRRLASRLSYGRGVGACCALWLCRRDPYALYILGRWLFFRASMMAAAVRSRKLTSLYEELLVVRGTISGLLYGCCPSREIQPD